MQIIRLSNDINYFEEIVKIGADKMGAQIMSKKADNLLLKFYELDIRAANILKQEALSLGADLAVGENCSKMVGKTTDAILIIDRYRLAKLIEKLKLQPFGLKNISLKLKEFLNIAHCGKIKLMGVLNINEDSFYAKSRTTKDNFLNIAKKAFDDGADILDIGAVSSRPNSIYPGVDVEFERIKPIIDELKQADLIDKISLDSFEPKVIQYALDSGVKIINDITGLSNIKVGELVAKYDATLVIMHKLGDTQTMQNEPSYKNVVAEVDEFFTERIALAKELGVQNIILDVGIGFGKTLEHNLSLIKNTNHFLRHGYEVLVGASRKSLIDKISPSKIEDRLGGTLALHLKSLDEGATIIRAHDIYEHKQVIAVWNALKKAV
ncbi:MAG: dihydropteroate synthase [Pseudomonadota bacterium]|jgi:dihydropteroate synthase